MQYRKHCMLALLSAVTVLGSQPAKAMCLGMYHFANPGLDVVKSEVQDMMGAKRQGEVEELVAALAKYKPTKIAVEMPLESQKQLDTEYAKYLSGTHKLSINEIEQVGYRLAARLNHKKLYSIDHKLDLEFDAPFKFLAKNHPTVAKSFQEVISTIGTAISEVDRKYTVPQILSIYNTRESELQNHRFYLEMAKYTDGTEYPGADVLATWYQRNVRIYSNLRQITEPGDRVLVIFGAGHIKMLNELISESGDLELVRASKYLPKAPIRKLPIDL